MVKPKNQEQTTEPIIIGEGSKENPEIYEIIVEKRNDGATWEEVSKALELRGFGKIAPQKLSSLHKVATARAIVTHNTAQEVFNDYTDIITETYGEGISLIKDLLGNLREINKLLKEKCDQGDMDTLQLKQMVIENIPQAAKILDQLLKFTKFQAELQDQVTKTAGKEVIWNESQMLESINQYLPVFIGEKVKELKKEYGDNIPTVELEKMLKRGLT